MELPSATGGRSINRWLGSMTRRTGPRRQDATLNFCGKRRIQILAPARSRFCEFLGLRRRTTALPWRFGSRGPSHPASGRQSGGDNKPSAVRAFSFRLQISPCPAGYLPVSRFGRRQPPTITQHGLATLLGKPLSFSAPAKELPRNGWAGSIYTTEISSEGSSATPRASKATVQSVIDESLSKSDHFLEWKVRHRRETDSGLRRAGAARAHSFRGFHTLRKPRPS
jgi:hypothetical protein